MRPEKGLAVDASMRSGKLGASSGVVEWRGVDLETGKEVFRSEVHPDGTINMGELAAILDGLKWAMDNDCSSVYSDSKIAIAWAQKPEQPPKIMVSKASMPLCNRIWSDMGWLELDEVKSFMKNVLKFWDSKAWGENPADLGYKGYQRKQFFAVKEGRKTGIFSTWKECAEQVSGYPAARFKGFITVQAAEAYLGQ